MRHACSHYIYYWVPTFQVCRSAAADFAVDSNPRTNSCAHWLSNGVELVSTASGGSMNTTVRHTTTSPMAELSALLRTQLDRMLRCGTTPIDTKSGYGLDTDTELKVLRVLHAASTGDDAYPVKIVSNCWADT
ncbi:hypothetical protein PF001_g18499 [Phytophthora fragariae]|uniref:Uncharacterized protein n=1 Tax=Phytophthora fragariae TaxID=53985 RepID=A0A6A4CPC4_9STRA|nr:hypothetical protein PF006_g18173 [Phytophthora fragariae]KAE9292909.1 hypothetical protein PF001_g18499 [Phytophthora fragariae]